MEKGFEEQAHDAACMAIGEAVWQMAVTGELMTPDTIASKILLLLERRNDLAASIALSVLFQV